MWAAAIFFLLSAVASAEVRLQRSSVTTTYVDYEFAITNQGGVPKLDWDLFSKREPRLVKREQPAIILENEFFRATILPERGMIYSFVHKRSGREQLWRNPAAKPIRANNDTGYWVTWGGVEHVLPRGEHGTSHALRWQYDAVQKRGREAGVRMSVTEPLTGLQHVVVCTAVEGQPSLRVDIEIRNKGDREVQFSHWTNNMFAPGGRGEIGADTEIVVPAERFVPADKPFNSWMADLVGPATESPLRFLKSWKDIGDLTSTPLREPLFAAFSQKDQQAVIRLIDTKQTPGLMIWTWGFQPALQRQKEYTAAPPNMGYVEMWNGTARDYSDASLKAIASGDTISWREELCALDNVKSSEELRGRIAECRR